MASRDDDTTETEDRETILARRTRFVAAAIAGLTTSTLATACPCLKVAAPDPGISSDSEVTPSPRPGSDGRWATTRFFDHSDLRYDMHVTIVTFEPGGVIPFAETHVMEHGLYVLEGKAVYRLNRDWEAGFTISGHTHHREALEGAQFVVSAIEVGPREELWKKDYELTIKHGLRQPYGENGGPGGFAHAADPGARADPTDGVRRAGVAL